MPIYINLKGFQPVSAALLAKTRKIGSLLAVSVVLGAPGLWTVTETVQASQQEPVANATFGKVAKKESGYVATYDATPQLRDYAKLVYLNYAETHRAAKHMQAVIAAFLKKPTESGLANARTAWRNARVAYLQTEVFRFSDGPIDHGPNAKGVEGPEGRINAWPMNEAIIDYVKGNPKAGIINNPKIKIDRAMILKNDQVSDEADVTTGWHAIEFLLWGQDLNAAGPGNRPVSDYTSASKSGKRRAAYLTVVTDLLVDDLGNLANAWVPGKKDNYAAKFIAMDPAEGLSRILTGMTMLSGFELANERVAAGLDSGDQEDEHSCFSDNTRADFIYNAMGIRNVYFGTYGEFAGTGLNELIAALSPKLNQTIIDRLNRVDGLLAGLPEPWDQVLALKKGAPMRKRAELAHAALIAEAESFRDVGKLLGVRVNFPTE